MVKGLPSMHKILDSITSTPYTMGIVVHTCRPGTWEVKLEGADVQGSPQLHIKQVRGYIAKAQNKKCHLVKIKFIDKPKTLSLEDKEKPFVS